MRKLIILAVVAIPLIVLVTLPAGVITRAIDTPSALGEVSGTIWSGDARWRQPGHAPLALNWRWQGGRSWQWQAHNGQTDVVGLWQPGRALELSEVSGSVDLARLDLAHWFYATHPTGELDLAIDRAVLAPDAAPQVSGQVVWRDARLDGRVQEALGDIEIEFEPGDSVQLAHIRSRQVDPLRLRGRIEFDQDAYSLDLWLRAHPDRPDLARQIGALGERQPDGQVRIELRGATGW